MYITINQINIKHNDTKKNIQNALRIIESEKPAAGTLFLFPELFTSGYLFDDEKDIHTLSEEYSSGNSIATLNEAARDYGITIVAGIAEKSANQYFNTAAIIDSNGLRHLYRKITQTKIDRQYFNRGGQLTTFEYQGVTFGITICFDIWFPEIIRKYTEQNIDVLLHLANFGGEQSLHIARARAIENNIHVITCNRVGAESTKEIQGTYCGKSQVISPTGEVLVSLGSEEEVVTVELDIEAGRRKKVIGVDLLDEIQAINNALKA